MNQLSQITNAQIIAELKSIAPSQFEKKFKGLNLEQISTAINKSVYGLSSEQIQLGFATVWQKGFIPDPILFRQWCLGNSDFRFEDEIANSYIGKHGALSMLLKYLSDNHYPITTAIKDAYDECYHDWQNILTQSDRTRAELAFKDRYDFIVRERIKNKIPSQPYIPPIAIKQKTVDNHTPADKNTAEMFLNKIKSKLKAVL